MFKTVKTDNFYLYSTEVDNLFIADFMAKAPGEYVKAYLLALMYARLGVPTTGQGIKQQLQMTDEQLDSCWEYWEGCGVVKRVSSGDENSYDVEFVNLRELIGTAAQPAQPHISTSLDDKELAVLYKNVQKATGRMIDRSEMQEIVAWLNDYNISSELILYCYKYCVAKRKSSAYRYVGTVLKDWDKKGIKTETDAEVFLGENDGRYSMYKEVFSQLGFSRNPTLEEKRLMDEWFDKYRYTMDEIKSACGKTAAISSPNIKYVDSVLRNVKGYTEEGSGPKESTAAAISRIYENIRKENEEKTETRRKEIFRKIPRLESIMTELSKASLSRSKAMLKRDRAAQSSAEQAIASLESQRVSLLANAGFGPDALDSIYTCPRCKDTGLLDDGTPCSCYASLLEKFNRDRVHAKI